jgi:hypothetical protein
MLAPSQGKILQQVPQQIPAVPHVPQAVNETKTKSKQNELVGRTHQVGKNDEKQKAPENMSPASVQDLFRLISDQVSQISALNNSSNNINLSDAVVKLQEIERKELADWAHNELVHWILTFRGKKFAKYVGNIIAHSLDGADMRVLSQNAMIKLCDSNEIHGELLYKFIRQRANPPRGMDLKMDDLDSRPPYDHKFDRRADDSGDKVWVQRKRRCKMAILTRDLLSYIEAFERIMKDGRLSMNAAAEHPDAPISRASYRNYLKVRQQLLELGFDLTDKKVLDAPFKDLLNSRGGRISPSRTSQGMDDDD